MSFMEEFNEVEFTSLIKKLDKKDSKYIKDSFYFNKQNSVYTIKPELKENTESLNKINEIMNNINKNKKDIAVKEENEELKKKISDYESIIKRQHAEFQNYRKRIEKEKSYIESSANQNIIEDLLPIIDSIEKAIELSSKDSDIIQFRDGVLLIQKQLSKTLSKYGLELINSIGTEFDPNRHEALQIDDSKNNYNFKTVISEWQKGYLFNGKVIRHSKVVVANPYNNGDNIINNNSSVDIKINEVISEYDFENKILINLESDDYNYIKESYEKIENSYKLKQEYSNNENRIQAINDIIKKII